MLVRSNVVVTPKKLTEAMNKLFSSKDQQPVQLLLETALDVIDQYLTPSTDSNAFQEPLLNVRFSGNFNTYLKWDNLGKSKEDSPKLYELLTEYHRSFNRSVRGQESPVALILKVLEQD